MERLIPVINKLQDVFNAIGNDPLDLPQIVVVGSQSSGKSSVLEAIVGRDFLPRGSGIVTRRPLVLQLIHLPAEVKKSANSDNNKEEEEDDGVEWGEFLHKPNEMFYDFEKIREEIERETDRLTGKNKGISEIPINLKIYSPHVLNLTLVDLPGITRVPVGDQPPDIEQQIRKMVKHYISKPNAIILAITAANTDLSNSDALQLAKELDTDGERTLGVLTKIDIMDKGTDALDMLLGRVIPLKLGFIGVVNRSQQDIITKKPIREAVKAESDFFATHSLYRNIASRCGTSYLSKTLNRILIQHIRNVLPDLKQKVNKMLAEYQQELLAYGDPLYDTKNSQGALLLQIITRFCANYRDAIDGKLTDLSVNELYGGARVNFIFNEIYARCLDTINPTEGLTTNDIRTAIRNATGPKAALFVPEVSFELLVKGQISRLEEPSLQCVELVHDELLRIIAQLETKELLRFSTLRDRVVEVVHNLLSKYKMPTKDMIANLINIEMAFINTNHPDFVGGDGAITAILERMSKQNQPNNNNPSNNNNMTVMDQQQQQQYQQQQMIQQQQQQMNRTNTNVAAGKSGIPPSQQQQLQGNPQDASQQGFLNMFFGRGGAQPPSSTNPQQQQQPSQSQLATSPGKDPRLEPASSTSNSSSSSTSPISTSPTLPSNSMMRKQRGSSFGTSMNNNNNSMMMRGIGDRLPQVPVTIKPTNTPTDKENFETELIKFLLISYFDIVRKNVKDTVPKSIMHFLVNKSKETIQNELVACLYREELFDDLLSESSQIAQKRESCQAMINILRRAHEILNEVRDYQIH